MSSLVDTIIHPLSSSGLRKTTNSDSPCSAYGQSLDRYYMNMMHCITILYCCKFTHVLHHWDTGRFVMHRLTMSKISRSNRVAISLKEIIAYVLRDRRKNYKIVGLAICN